MGTLHKLPAGADQQSRYETRRTRWAEQEWRDTMQAPRRVPFERIDMRASRSREVRKLIVWACITWTLFCIILAAAAVVAVS